MPKTKKLPKLMQTCLWSYDLDELNPEDPEDKHLIITQVLNHGTWEQLNWLLKNYAETEIKEVIKNPDRGMWHKDVLNYWFNIFDIKLSKETIDKALFSLSVKKYAPRNSKQRSTRNIF